LNFSSKAIVIHGHDASGLVFGTTAALLAARRNERTNGAYEFLSEWIRQINQRKENNEQKDQKGWLHLCLMLLGGLAMTLPAYAAFHTPGSANLPITAPCVPASSPTGACSGAGCAGNPTHWDLPWTWNPYSSCPTGWAGRLLGPAVWSKHCLASKVAGVMCNATSERRLVKAGFI